eukprot:gene39489-48796_t
MTGWGDKTWFRHREEPPLAARTRRPTASIDSLTAPKFWGGSRKSPQAFWKPWRSSSRRAHPAPLGLRRSASQVNARNSGNSGGECCALRPAVLFNLRREMSARFVSRGLGVLVRALRQGSVLGRQHRHGDARDAGQLARVVDHVNLPNLRGAANVHWPCRAGNPAAGGGAQVIGIDVQPHGAMALGACAVSTQRAQGLGQHHAHAAMQQAKRLAGALVDRHAAAHEWLVTVLALVSFRLWTEMGFFQMDMGVLQWVNDAPDAGQALTILLAYRDCSYSSWAEKYGESTSHINDNPTLRLIATGCGVNVEQVQKQVKARIKEEDAATAAADAAKAAKQAEEPSAQP